MWQIIINGPGYFDTAYDLPDGITTLGRADENDIVLSGDLVSRHHARIHAEGDALAVEDLGSRNGTKLNGQVLQGSAELRVGDVVSVGENALSVRQPSTVENAATEMVNTGAAGVRRFGEEIDLGNAMVIAKNVKDSVVMRALDNVLPFANPFGENSPAPAEDEAEGQQPLDAGLLLLLFRASAALSRAPSLQAFLDDTIDRLLEVVKATTAVVLLRHHSGAMVPAAVRHRGALSQGEVPVSDAIIAAALSKGEALAVADVRDDSRFAQRESVMLYGVDQVLCVPIGDKDPYTGVLYVNKSGGNQAELEQLLDVCTAVSHLIATGVAKFRAEDRGRKEDRLRRALERFHPPEIVERRVAELAKPGGGGALERLEQKHVSVVLADISGFTALVQKGDPDSVLQILNEFYQRMTGLVFSFDGTVDKFMGDAVLALFGAPYSRGDDALRAVRAALTMRQDWNRAMRLRPPAQRLELRLAISTGPVLAGLVGQESRLDYTALGETVNLAFALCATAQPGQILITGKTLAAIGARFDVTPLGDRAVRGKEKVPVFEVLEEDVPVHTNPGLS